MKISAIICEYNPMHNGHLYHIKQTRKNGATHVIGILSGNFVQRGDVALLDKFDRAQLALRGGVDLVLELPVAFSSATAELYASGAVSILHHIGVVDELSFGSACPDLECLELLTEAAVSTRETYQERILERMRAGESYPAALCEIVRQRYGPKVAAMMHDPNNVLAIEYMKAIRRYDAKFRPFSLQRQCVMHDSLEPQDMFASASFIRKSIAEGDRSYLNYVPTFTAQMLSRRLTEGRTADIRRLERVLLYRLRTMDPAELNDLPDMTPTLQNRIYAARTAGSLDELLAAVKTKAYTMARIRRILMCALIGIHRDDQKYNPPYARVLALNDRGREILAAAKKKSSIDISTSLARLSEGSAAAERFVRLEERAANVYGLAQGDITSAEQEFRTKISLEAAK
ncbi:MAG: nucleotidyltransferase family protein [Oscillospiraceae bacterium]|nr:nucleotidyltransferase family protein [Oscillospiraceae bacterium]